MSEYDVGGRAGLTSNVGAGQGQFTPERLTSPVGTPEDCFCVPPAEK